jgi:uncharacterized membrane protein
VVAIIITLMVLEIKLPQVTAENLLNVLSHIGIYALSFVVIGITWLNYSNFFKYIEQLNTKIIWLNLGFLFMLSLVPLPTQALGENFYTKESHMFYGIILATVALFYTLMQHAANPYISHISKHELSRMNKKNWFAVIMYAISVPLSFISVWLSATVFVAMPAMYFLPERKLAETKATR